MCCVEYILVPPLDTSAINVAIILRGRERDIVRIENLNVVQVGTPVKSYVCVLLF